MSPACAKSSICRTRSADRWRRWHTANTARHRTSTSSFSLRAEDVPRFLGQFPKAEYYHDERAALEAVATGGQFNVVLMGESLKIDIHVAADPIAKEQIARARRLKSPLGAFAYFSPPEELILKKLEYFNFSGSERQLRDIATMLRVGGDDIDQPRIEELVHRFGLTKAWQAVLARLERG